MSIVVMIITGQTCYIGLILVAVTGPASLEFVFLSRLLPSCFLVVLNYPPIHVVSPNIMTITMI